MGLYLYLTLVTIVLFFVISVSGLSIHAQARSVNAYDYDSWLLDALLTVYYDATYPAVRRIT